LIIHCENKKGLYKVPREELFGRWRMKWKHLRQRMLVRKPSDSANTLSQKTTTTLYCQWEAMEKETCANQKRS